VTAIGDALRALAAAVDAHLAQPLPSAVPSDDDRVGAAEAARLGLGAKAFRRACRTGALRAERSGRAFVARRADLVAFVESRRVVPRAAPAAETTAPDIRSAVLAEVARGRLRPLPGGRGK
jgi:hypothetical protein